MLKVSILAAKVAKMMRMACQVGERDVIYPHTDAWTPNGFLLPQTPLLLPQARPVSLAPEEGLEAADVDRSLLLLVFADRFSFGAKP